MAKVRKEEYLSIITSEHRLKPKFVQTVSEMLTPIGDLASCLESYEFNFNLDNAEGKQLDVIGELVGANRVLDFQLSEGGTNILSDDDYRFLIKSKVAQNTWNGGIEGLNEIWTSMFPESTLIIYDYQNMSCTFLLVSSLKGVQLEMLLNDLLLPKPVGVSYEYSFVAETLFAYNIESHPFGGYDAGYWHGKFDWPAD